MTDVHNQSVQHDTECPRNHGFLKLRVCEKTRTKTKFLHILSNFRHESHKLKLVPFVTNTTKPLLQYINKFQIKSDQIEVTSSNKVASNIKKVPLENASI